jgi:hypothetical protein
MKPKVKCKLHTKASEELEISVAEDLEAEDRHIKDIINDNKKSPNDTGNSREGNSGS